MSPRIMALLTVLLAAGCGPWRLWGEIPAAPEARAEPLFYSDLGPDTVDVSAYPPELKRDYAVYARACSRCHTLARSINAPYVSRAWWEFYIARMRVRATLHGEPLSPREIQSALDFLEHDSNVRKVARAPEFDAAKAELKRRFEAALDERIERLQKEPQPKLLP